MRMELQWSGRRALVVLLGLMVAACGGGGGSNSTDIAPAPPGPQFVLQPVGSTSPSGSLLMSVSAPDLAADLADRIEVLAQLLDPGGEPLEGRVVTFGAGAVTARFEPGLPEDDPDVDFPAASIVTDVRGVARVTFIAPSEPGRIPITATTTANLGLSGLIFVQAYDVGFIPGDGEAPSLLPSEIVVEDPDPGMELSFLIIGGTPAGGPGEPPYRLQNAESGIGIASLVFEGRFPAEIEYRVTARVSGSHTFGVIDADGRRASATVNVGFSPVVIAPEKVLVEPKRPQTFVVSGGLPPYDCSASTGELDPTEVPGRGGSLTFLYDESLTEDLEAQVTCTDEIGQAGQAEITVQADISPPAPPTPTPLPAAVGRVVVEAAPPSLSGPAGGQSTVTATVLDTSFSPLSRVPVVWALRGEQDEPTAAVPSLSSRTGVTVNSGETSVVLTVPPGTAPQFLVVTAETDNGKVGEAQISVTSQVIGPAGPPAQISAAVLRADGCQLNQDGTLTAIVSALVTDAEGNPVDDGIEVEWESLAPAGAAVVSPSYTNAPPPCDVSAYRAGCAEDGTLLTISPQPGTATTCVNFAATEAGEPARVGATVAGTMISSTTDFTLPSETEPPEPTPTPTPAPTPSPGPPSLAPAGVALEIGQSQTFAVSGGLPPYAISASGGTASPTTIPGSGGTFEYEATSVGTFAILASDSNGQVASATVVNSDALVLRVTPEGPVSVSISGLQLFTITGGGTPPYTVTLTGGLGGFIAGSPLPAPGTFSYNAPAFETAGQILVTDSESPANSVAIVVTVP